MWLPGKTFSQIPAAGAQVGPSDSIIGIQNGHDVRFSLAQLPSQQSLLMTSVVSLTSAQILALGGPPFITVIPAQGPGTLQQIVKVTYVSQFGGVAYTGGPAGLFYNNNAAADTGDDSIVGASASSISAAISQNFEDIQVVDSLNINQPVTYNLNSPSAPYVGGNGTLTITALWELLTAANGI